MGDAARASATNVDQWGAMTTTKKTAKPSRRPQQRALTVSSPTLLIDGSDKEFRQLLHDTLAFAARIQEVRGRFGQFIGLTGTQYTVLISISHLARQGNEVGINLVAERLHLSGAFVTLEVNKLVTEGLVDKWVNPADRRRVLLSITPKAQALLNELAIVQRPVNDTLFDCLTPKDFQLLRRLVAKLVDSSDRSLKLLDYLVADRASEAPSSGERRR